MPSSLIADRYEIVGLIGSGGMATVYLAVQESLNREVALKVLSPTLAADAAFAERFLREAQNGRHIMADEQDRSSLLSHVTHFADAFLLEFSIAHCENFIHNEDLGFEMRSDGKSEAQVHA